METSLWSFLLCGSVAVLLRYILNFDPQKKIGVEFSIYLFFLVLTRPESYAWGAIFLSIYFLELLAYHKNIFQTAKIIALPTAIFFLSFAGLISFRLWYFGYPLPNTYYAKVSSDIIANLKFSLTYLARFFVTTNPLMVIIVSVFAKIIFTFVKEKNIYNPHKNVIFVISIITFFSLLVVMPTGAEHFGLNRLYQALMSITYVGFIVVMHDFINRYNLQFNQFYLALTVIIFSWFIPNKKNFAFELNKSPIWYEFFVAEKVRDTALELNDFFQENGSYPLLAEIAAGIKFKYKGEVLDVVGLNNVRMAHASRLKNPEAMSGHSSFNKNVFYEYMPDLFLETAFINDSTNFLEFEKRENFHQSFQSKNFLHIEDDPKFKALYTPVFITSKRSGKVLYSYVSNKFRNSLDKNKYTVVGLR